MAQPETCSDALPVHLLPRLTKADHASTFSYDRIGFVIHPRHLGGNNTRLQTKRHRIQQYQNALKSDMDFVQVARMNTEPTRRRRMEKRTGLTV
jgi:RNase adaptor protein for sRNA GlmZ degradation